MNSSFCRILAPTILVVAFVSCSSTSPNLTPNAVVIERLYFGRNIDSARVVTDSSWAVFLRTVVTPKFPDGFTVWAAEGQWKHADGSVVHEPSYVLEIIVRADAQSADQSVRHIIDTYKTWFQQESVLRVTTSGKATF